MNDDQQQDLIVRCCRVFTPSLPINRRALFAGRAEEIRKITDAVNSPGRHAVLYGDPGVGKTSLATILAELYSKIPSIRIGKANCDTNDTFASVWDKVLGEIAVHVEEPDGSRQKDSAFRLNQWINHAEYVSPGHIRKVLQEGTEYIPELVLIFDEFNQLDRKYRTMFAHAIKDLSDSMTGATVILVGVAKDIKELIADHTSIDRNIAQIKMPPMSSAEIKQILHNGLTELNMTMSVEASETILALSQGYPHYAHLLGKESSLSAINNRRLDIHGGDVSAAIKVAITDVGYSLPDVYHKATLAQRKGTLFEHVLIACSLANVDELGFFSSTDVKAPLSAITNKPYEIYSFSQHLEKFSSEESRGPVFEKRGALRSYRYRFLDPLLRPYAIIKGMADGLVTIEMLQRLNSPPKKRKGRSPKSPHLVPTPKQTRPGPGLFDNI